MRLHISAFILTGFIYVFLFVCFYMTLEPAKREGSVNTIFTVSVFLHCVECLSACYFGIRMLPVCSQG